MRLHRLVIDFARILPKLDDGSSWGDDQTPNEKSTGSLNDLEIVRREARFKKKNVKLDRFILTETELKKIPGAENLTWKEMREQHKIVRQEGEYCLGLLQTNN